MDQCRLTDHHGKTVDFRNVILIMTTNAGASDMAHEGIGFGQLKREDVQAEAVKNLFTPEFRNRIDAKDRKSVYVGKCVAVSVNIGGSSIFKKKISKKQHCHTTK